MVDRAQFYSIFDMQGFDDSATPPWQMVPVDGDRYVLLTDSTGLSLRSAYPPVAMWHEVSGRDDVPFDRGQQQTFIRVLRRKR